MEADRKGENVRVKRDYQKGPRSYFDELGDSKVDYLLDEKWKLLPVIYKQRGLLLQHINSFNNFLNVEIQKIVAANDEIRSTTNPHIWCKYTKVYIGKPCVDESDMTRNWNVTPMMCRIRGLTYSAPIYVDMVYSKMGGSGKEYTQQKETQIEIGKMPIMLGSDNCVLFGKSRAARARLKECPYDPGGYFIVKGTEKVILIKEELSKNRIMVELDKTKLPKAEVTSLTVHMKSRTQVINKKGRFYVANHKFVDPIPFVIMMKALGVVSEQQIVSYVGAEPRILEALGPSLADCAGSEIMSEDQALVYVASKLQPSRFRNRSAEYRQPLDNARDVLCKVVLPHVRTDKYFDFRRKAIYLGNMVRRMVLVEAEPRLLCDRDYYGNKRIELAGQALVLLFEDLFKTFNRRIQKEADAVLQKPNRAFQASMLTYLPRHKAHIQEGLVNSISTGKWRLTRFRKEETGVTETLSSMSFIARVGHITRIRSNVEKTRKIAGPRSLQPSQWGMVCPSDTPEGEQCGLVKSLALLAHITTDEDPTPISKTLSSLGVEDISHLSGAELYVNKNTHIVLLNGSMEGATDVPHQLVDALQGLRRRGRLGEFVSIYLNQIDRTVNIACDAGRLCRPLIIVDTSTGKPLVTRQHIYELQSNVRDFRSFITEGFIEYVDVNEENACLIAMHEHQLVPGKHTHLEIDPVSIMGVVSGLIPFPHHNQSPRNTYQCAMGKQAIGTYGLNQYERVDISPMNVLVYPMRPLIGSKILDLVHFNELGAGQNAVVAVMSYSGYDIEDASVLNRASVDRGYGRAFVFTKFITAKKTHPNQMVDRIEPPPKRANVPGEINDRDWRKINSKFQALGEEGVVEVGVRVKENDIMVNMFSPADTNSYTTVQPDYIPAALKYTNKSDDVATVDKVLITSNEHEKYVVRIMTRDFRRPELGDKFSSRHGQKGVVGLIVPQEDMPFNEQGVCPDMIMNPHGFPSRMTIGKMLELVAGKASLMDGKVRYGTAFADPNVDEISQVLTEYGYNYSGKDFLYSGITGEPILAYIFMGPIYYQRLKHMVKDKMFARARGPNVMMTRQPTQGRARKGGLRVGEMERDCLVAHGTAMLMMERMMVSSDPFNAAVCSSCGILAYPGWCQYCRKTDTVKTLRIPYACKLLFQELQSMNISPKISLEPGGYYDQYTSFQSSNMKR